MDGTPSAEKDRDQATPQKANSSTRPWLRSPSNHWNRRVAHWKGRLAGLFLSPSKAE